MIRASIPGFLTAFLFPVFLVAPASSQTIELLTQEDLANGAESIAYSPLERTVAATILDPAPPPEEEAGPRVGVQLFSLGADGALTEREFVSVAGEFGGAIAAVSSVALDPLGRGFGVATVIPAANRTSTGVLVFFDHREGTAAGLKTVTVGFHPTFVVFSRDGSKVFVANEGEYTGNSIGQGGGGGNVDAPGSVSVVDLSAVEAIEDLEALGQTEVVTHDFSAPNLAAGVTLDNLRFNEPSFSQGNAFRHVEPESIAEGEEVLYVTLQENNAIAEYALSGADAGKFTRIRSLGAQPVTIDASDVDGAGGTAAALIDDLVKGAPMPSSIATYSIDGVPYTITANTGAFRPDNDDRIRVRSFSGVEIGVSIDRADAALGRLRVVRDLSDPDDDDLLNEVVIPGTRSFSIWEVETGERTGDTGSFEPLLLDLFPDLHNVDGEGGLGTFDFMSPEKGPEPMAMAQAKIGSNEYVFVAMARQGAILIYDVNDPENPEFISANNDFEEGLVAPASLTVVAPADSPSGAAMLLAGYGGGGKIAVYRLSDGAPVITTRGKVTAKGTSRSVTIRGAASANVVRVALNGRPAAGTTVWSGKLPFPTSKKSLRVDVRATTVFGVTSSRLVKVLRKRSR